MGEQFVWGFAYGASFAALAVGLVAARAWGVRDVRLDDEIARQRDATADEVAEAFDCGGRLLADRDRLAAELAAAELDRSALNAELNEANDALVLRSVECREIDARRCEAEARVADTARHRDSVREELLLATTAMEAMAAERDSLRSQLADTHKSLDAAMVHVEQLVMKRDAMIVERDSLLTQVRGLHEAVQAVTDERNAAAARADANDARCQQAVRDRAKTQQKMREVVTLIDAMRAEANS